jgi:aminoglycoside N3'-acetyltransferase
MSSIVTEREIVAGLRTLGLGPGANLVMHSSLKSFGHVEGGPQPVIQALMEVVTPEGTLVLPSFNHGAPFGPQGAGYFDPRETPTTNGAIPDAFWRLPDVQRSLDPTHACAAWGRHAVRYTTYHHRTLTMGPQSPLGLLHVDDGFGLLVGVDYGTNTFHHVVEMSTGAPCLGQRTEAYPVRLPDGRTVLGRTWGWRERSCPFTDQNRYHLVMRARGLHRETMIGQSRIILYRLRDGFQVISEILRQGMDGFPPCSHCPIRPRRVAETVPSDWDAEKQRPLPDSVAWSY